MPCFGAIGLNILTTCDTIPVDMKLNFLSGKKKAVKTISDYKQEALVRLGRELFKKLLEIVINIPVVLL